MRQLPDLGINFIDTADSYSPDVSEQLIAQALSPYDGVVVATKAGLRRSGPDAWIRFHYGSYIGSTRRYPETSSLTPSRECATRGYCVTSV
jgi:aryl-alcohol dehydrogenase-like predicted oxidoreductase